MAKTTIFGYWSNDIKFPDKLRVKVEDNKIKFVGSRDVKPSQWMLFIGVFKGIKYHNKLYYYPEQDIISSHYTEGYGNKKLCKMIWDKIGAHNAKINTVDAIELNSFNPFPK